VEQKLIKNEKHSEQKLLSTEDPCRLLGDHDVSPTGKKQSRVGRLCETGGFQNQQWHSDRAMDIIWPYTRWDESAALKDWDKVTAW